MHDSDVNQETPDESLVSSVVDEMLSYAAEDVVMDESGKALDDPDWVLSLNPAGRCEIVRRVDPTLEGLPKHLLRSIHCQALERETYHCYANWLFVRARTWAKHRQKGHPSIGDWIVYSGEPVAPDPKFPVHLRRVRNVSRDGLGFGPTYHTGSVRVTGLICEAVYLGGGRTREEAVSAALTNNPDRHVALIRWMGREGISR